MTEAVDPEASSPRSRCRLCHRWMSWREPTEATPARRRPRPHNDRCLDCPPDHYACGCPEAHWDFDRKARETRAQEEDLRKGKVLGERSP